MSRRQRAGAGTPATQVLARDGAPHTLRAYDHDPTARERGLSFGMEAALALGLEPAQVFKTLLADVDGRLVVAVVPVDRSLDLKALAAAVRGKRAVMAEPADAERATGYVVGGISPLGQRRPLPTVVDASALEWATVLVSAGRRGLDVELAPADLVRLTSAVTAPVAR
ncbi:MAG TPA: Cys-tRNA(Pro) deacylase [Kineosporiaceae bacterium]|nr:Cys-tRNA(Pro) deacylase [Kineosporiaceae bacterium]